MKRSIVLLIGILIGVILGQNSVITNVTIPDEYLEEAHVQGYRECEAQYLRIIKNMKSDMD